MIVVSSFAFAVVHYSRKTPRPLTRGRGKLASSTSVGVGKLLQLSYRPCRNHCSRVRARGVTGETSAKKGEEGEEEWRARWAARGWPGSHLILLPPESPTALTDVQSVHQGRAGAKEEREHESDNILSSAPAISHGRRLPTRLNEDSEGKSSKRRMSQQPVLFFLYDLQEELTSARSVAGAGESCEGQASPSTG